MSDQTLRDELTSLTSDLVAIPSIDTRPDALRAVIDYAERYARAIEGLHITAGEQAGKPYLIATLHDTRAPDLMLNAHLDVVPGRAEQFQPRIENGRIYGRATQDMKGSGAVLLRLRPRGRDAPLAHRLEADLRRGVCLALSLHWELELPLQISLLDSIRSRPLGAAMGAGTDRCGPRRRRAGKSELLWDTRSDGRTEAHSGRGECFRRCRAG